MLKCQPGVNPDIDVGCLGNGRVWAGIFFVCAQRACQPPSQPGHQTAEERPWPPATPVLAICPVAIRLQSPALRLPLQLSTLLSPRHGALAPPSPLLAERFSVSVLPHPCLLTPRLTPLTRSLLSLASVSASPPTARHRPCRRRWRRSCAIWGRRWRLPLCGPAMLQRFPRPHWRGR